MQTGRILLIYADLLGDYLLFRNHLLRLRAWTQARDLTLCFVGNAAIKPLYDFIDPDTTDHDAWIESYPPYTLTKKKLLKFPLAWWQSRQAVRALKTPRMVDALWCPSILPWVVSFISMHTASPVKVSRDVEDPGYHRLQRWIYSDLMRPENYYKFIFEQHGDFFEYVTGDSAWSQEVLLSFPRETMLGTFPRQDVLLAHSPYCVVFPDSQEDYKQWPPQRIAETVACIRRETGLRVLLCGHGKKRGLAEAILSQLPSRDGVLNLMGETTLVDIFDVIGQSAFVVCNDSFALHAANAMAVSPICITAGLYPGRYLPYPAPYQTAPHFYIYPPLTGQPGQHPLESITVRHVMPAVHAALAAAPKTGVTIGSDAAMVAFERERVRLSA